MKTYHMEICDDYCSQFEAEDDVAACEIFRAAVVKQSATPYGFLFPGPIVSGVLPIAWWPGGAREPSVTTQVRN